MLVLPRSELAHHLVGQEPQVVEIGEVEYLE